MKIIEIKRTVSDLKFNNMSASVVLNEGDDPIEVAVELDGQIKEMMAAIEDKSMAVEDFRREKRDALNILKDALDHATNLDIPF